MAEDCEASRFLLYAFASVVASASSKVDAPALAERTCTFDEITSAPAWQAKSARDGRVNGYSHLSSKEDFCVRASSTRSSIPQANYSLFAARDLHSPCLNYDNSVCTPAELATNSCKPRVITCIKYCMSGHVASASSSDSRPARKCYACGGIGHIARVCFPRTAQSAANASFFYFRRSRVLLQIRLSIVMRSCGFRRASR